MTTSRQAQPSSEASEVTIEPASPRDIPAISALLMEGDRVHQSFDRRAIRQGEPHPAEREWLSGCIGHPDYRVLPRAAS
ncbi:MAG: hypothetical protein J4G15_10150 [Alphaproteobacteria bacterium]|nr:hypothetical protein [Alphaproteobacteria bacterium]